MADKSSSDVPTSEAVPSDRSLAFVVTGFGPFQGVSDNPTTVLVQRLVKHLEQQACAPQHHLASITTTLVLETSADCVKQRLDSLYEKICCSNNADFKVVVFLHIGVNYRGVNYQLERCAYNNASFRIPDERGYQPNGECILEAIPLKTCLITSLDVKQLCEELNEKTQPATPAVVSTDPGRFVCNFLYCYSLSKCQSMRSQNVEEGTPRVHSLFIHVPPFAVAPEEEQMEFITNAMETIYRQVQQYS